MSPKTISKIVNLPISEVKKIIEKIKKSKESEKRTTVNGLTEIMKEEKYINPRILTCKMICYN